MPADDAAVILDAAGRVELNSFGQVILNNALVNTCLSCSCFGFYAPLCDGSGNDCVCFCNVGLKDFSIAKECSCPCGRSGWPPRYRTTWSGGTLRSDRYHYKTAGDDEFYCTFLDTALPDVGSCDGEVDVIVPMKLERVRFGIVEEERSDLTGVMRIADVDANRQCIDGVEQIVIDVSVTAPQVNAGVVPSSFDGDLIGSNPSISGETPTGADPCVSGSAAAERDLEGGTFDKNLFNEDGGGDPGTVSWRPACYDCDEVWIGDCGLDSPSVCEGQEVEGYLFSGDYDPETDDAIYHHFGPMPVGTTEPDSGGHDVTATAETSDDAACDDILCPTGCPDFGHCESSTQRCFKYTVTSIHGEVSWLVCGYCPPAGIWNGSGAPPEDGFLTDTIPQITHGPDAGGERFIIEFTYPGDCP